MVRVLMPDAGRSLVGTNLTGAFLVS